MTTHTGGPAFPHSSYQPGMTLRDYFAAQALPAVVTENGSSSHYAADSTREAYAIADAMLAERNKQ